MDEVVDPVSLQITAAKKLILGNTAGQVQQICGTLSKVIRNILQSPGDKRKRTLRLSNVIVYKKIVMVPGALDYLIVACGFEQLDRVQDKVDYTKCSGSVSAMSSTDSLDAMNQSNQVTEKYIFMPDPINRKALEQALQWVDATSSKCSRVRFDHRLDVNINSLEYDQRKCTGSGKIKIKSVYVVDCIVKLLFPNGSSHLLGFDQSDLLRTLYDVAQLLGHFDFRFNLCLRHPKHVFREEDMCFSFEHHKISERVVLAVIPAVKSATAFQSEAVNGKVTLAFNNSLRKPVGTHKILSHCSQRDYALNTKRKERENALLRKNVLREFESDRRQMDLKTEWRRNKQLAEKLRQQKEAQLLEIQRESDKIKATGIK